MSRVTVLIAGLLGAAAVMLGAYAAHGLEQSLSEQGLASEDIAKRLQQCDIAVRYHMLHSVVLLCLGLAAKVINPAMRRLATAFVLVGIVLFCGGLYSMVFLGQMGHWAIVPLGGLNFILGWLSIGGSALRQQWQMHLVQE